MIRYWALLFLIGLSSFTNSQAQTYDDAWPEQAKAIVDHAGRVYGPDDLLVSGRQYLPRHTKAKGHPFFPKKEQDIGKLFVKGKTFKDLILDYDAERDKVILREKLKSGHFAQLLLLDDFIDSLYIGNHFFINASQLYPETIPNGFYEQIYSGNFTFMVKHNKVFKADYSQNTPYGKYSDLRSVYYIHKEEVNHKIASKKALLKYFEAHKKSIKKFIKKNRIRYKKAGNAALFNLMKYCDELG